MLTESGSPDLAIDVHPSVEVENLQVAAIRSLQANRMDPKALYVTSHQASLWRDVFFKHSPLHGNPEFTRIYRDAFASALDRFPAEKCLLVGLGCGTGAKELELYGKLRACKRDAIFAAIDVSSDLVLESAQKLIRAGAAHERSLVCDLTESAFLREWLGSMESELPRLITFFGLVPNFAPSEVVRLIQAVLRPGDVMLINAHLAPVQDGGRNEPASAMQRVLPQYDNPETLAWLAAGLEQWGLEQRLESPGMVIGEVEGIPAFLGQARWKSGEAFKQWGHSFSPAIEQPFRIFTSLRYTPKLFENLLRSAGFEVKLLAITACREEAIWSVRRL